MNEELPPNRVVYAPCGHCGRLEVQLGDEVYVGKLVLVMEAMKMEHEVRAEVSGIVERLALSQGIRS